MSYDEDRAKERAQQVANRTQAIEAVTVVMATIGEGWSIKPDRDSNEANNVVVIQHTDGRQIWFRWDYYGSNGKINISGNYQYGDHSLGINFPHGHSQPSISVSLSRGGAVMAKEILRRFLPDYTKYFTEISGRVKAATDSRANRLARSEMLAKVAKADMTRVGYEGFSTYRSNGAYVEVKVYSEQVDVKVTNCSDALARQILDLVNASHK